MTDFLSKLGITIESLMPVVFKIALLVLALLITVKVINNIFRKLKTKYGDGSPISAYLSPLRYVTLALVYIVFGASIASEIPAFDTLMKSVLASSGIVAVIVGVASQQAVGNMISGIIVRFSKPFVVGDTIRYVDSDSSGVVEEVGLRHTVIRTYENRRLIVPNSMINANIIENASYGDLRISLYLEVGITYDSDAELAMSAMAEAIAGHPSFVDARTPEQARAGEPPVKVRVTSLSESAVMLRAWIWAENTAHVPQVKSDMYLAIKQAFADNGISIAYPHVVLVDSSTL